MRIHQLKLHEDFCDDVLSGKKSFEIRKDDRDFQEGDHIKFRAVDDDGICTNHPINGKEFEITYALVGWGLKDGYVALSIKEVNDGMAGD